MGSVLCDLPQSGCRQRSQTSSGERPTAIPPSRFPCRPDGADWKTDLRGWLAHFGLCWNDLASLWTRIRDADENGQPLRLHYRIRHLPRPVRNSVRGFGATIVLVTNAVQYITLAIIEPSDLAGNGALDRHWIRRIWLTPRELFLEEENFFIMVPTEWS